MMIQFLLMRCCPKNLRRHDNVVPQQHTHRLLSILLVSSKCCAFPSHKHFHLLMFSHNIVLVADGLSANQAITHHLQRPEWRLHTIQHRAARERLLCIFYAYTRCTHLHWRAGGLYSSSHHCTVLTLCTRERWTLRRRQKTKIPITCWTIAFIVIIFALSGFVRFFLYVFCSIAFCDEIHSIFIGTVHACNTSVLQAVEVKSHGWKEKHTDCTHRTYNKWTNSEW